MASVGGITVDLRVESDRFRSDLDNALKTLDAFQRSADRGLGKMGKRGGSAASQGQVKTKTKELAEPTDGDGSVGETAQKIANDIEANGKSQLALEKAKREQELEYEELKRFGEAVRQSVLTPSERHDEQVARLDKALKLTAIDDVTHERAVEEAAKQLDEALAQIDSTAKRVGEALNSVFSSVASGIEDAILGARSFSDVLQGVLQDIKRIFVQTAITGPLEESLKKIFGGKGGGSAGGGIVNFVGSLFTKASGGGFNAGQRLLVGERGPEEVVFGQGGRVIPNSMLDPGARGGVTVNVVNNAGSNVDVRESRDGRGGLNIDVMIDKVVGQALRRPGSDASRALFERYGLSNQVGRR